MGFRGWLTRVESPGEWDFLKEAIRINPLANGVSYIVDITEDIPVLSKGIWVAWSGDSNWSLTKYMPAMFYERTVFLDALLDKFPAFHDGDGPGHYGTYLKEKAVEPLLKKRWKPTIEDMACKVVGSKEELLEELQALRRGEIR